MKFKTNQTIQLVSGLFIFVFSLAKTFRYITLGVLYGMLLTFSFNRYGNLSLHSGAHERQSTIVNRQTKYIVSRSFTALWAILKSRALKSLNTHLKKLTRDKN